MRNVSHAAIRITKCAAVVCAQIILALSLSIATANLRAQDAAPDAPKPLAAIPFELFHNRIYLPVEVNGRGTVKMVVDTGAAYSGLSEASAAALQIRASGTAQLIGNGESKLTISLAKEVAFHVSGAELIEKSVAIIPFQDVESREGRKIEGILGVDFFRRFVVVIDYAAKMFSVYEPKNYSYQGTGEVVMLRFDKAALFHATISIAGSEPIAANLAIDSGTYSALRLYRPFVEKHNLLKAQAHIVDSLGFGIGGEFPEKLGRVARLQIGAIKFDEPITSFSESKSGATAMDSYDGTIGGEILSRFNVTLDYPHHEMILEPNANLTEPFRADASGLILTASGKDFATITIHGVIANSPAAAAGLREGDEILEVDDKDAKSIGLDGLRNIFHENGDYHLQIRVRQQLKYVEMRTGNEIY